MQIFSLTQNEEGGVGRQEPGGADANEANDLRERGEQADGGVRDPEFVAQNREQNQRGQALQN